MNGPPPPDPRLRVYEFCPPGTCLYQTAAPEACPCRIQGNPNGCEGMRKNPNKWTPILASRERRLTGAEAPPPAPRPERRPTVAENRRAYWAIRECDYRIPIKLASPDGYDPDAGGCGCQAICLAGMSRRPDRAVGSECSDCHVPLAEPPERPPSLTAKGAIVYGDEHTSHPSGNIPAPRPDPNRQEDGPKRPVRKPEPEAEPAPR